MPRQQPPVPSHPFVPACPICGAETVPIYDKNERQLFACNDCQTDVIVPVTAWAVASQRRSTDRK